jgi:hypothetical protein
MVIGSELSQMMRDASWLPHRYDPVHDAVHFRRVDREAHRKATFLTDEYLGVDATPVVIRRTEAIAATPAPSPVHFIFHSAFCCSTLLARAFDIPGKAMGLKEPTIFHDISGWHLRGADGRQVAAGLDDALRLLAQPFEAGEATIIKPSNLLNPLATAMMGMRPEARAVLLHAPLPVFLKSIAKKGIDGRLWVRDLLVKQLRTSFVDLGFAQEDYLGLTDLQVAAVGWLAQQALFGRMRAQFSGRVLLLDSETLLDRSREVIGEVATLYGLTLGTDEVAKITSGPAFATDSKTGTAFSPQVRTAAFDEAARHHADEIGKVCIWAEAVAKGAGVKV